MNIPGRCIVCDKNYQMTDSPYCYFHKPPEAKPVYYTVHFFDLLTNRRATMDWHFPWDEESGDFFWSEHNWACDCNRITAFDYDDTEDHPCGFELGGKWQDNRIIVEKIVDPEGNILYSEEIELIWN